MVHSLLGVYTFLEFIGPPVEDKALIVDIDPKFPGICDIIYTASTKSKAKADGMTIEYIL